MICKKYQDLSVKERIEYVGKVFHAIISHDEFFQTGEVIIIRAEKMGLFENVIINPQPIDEMPIVDKEN